MLENSASMSSLVMPSSVVDLEQVYLMNLWFLLRSVLSVDLYTLV